MMRRFILFLLLCLPLAMHAKPKVEVTGSVRFIKTARIPAKTWAYLNYRIKNEESRDANVRVVFTPHGQRNMTIYEQTFLAPANSIYNYRGSVTMGTVENYIVQVFVNGEKVSDQVEAKMLVRLARRSDRTIFFMDDSEEPRYGLFVKNSDLGGSYVNTAAGATTSPNHFAHLDDVHMIVLQVPDFSRMKNRQFKTLKRFVARGGTLLFADPQGVMSAWDSPLKEMLPVTPLRVRTIEKVNAFKKLDMPPLIWPEGSEFLESLPRFGVTVVKEGDFPFFQWGKYGLGRVGVCAINPSQNFISRDNVAHFSALYRHILNFGGNTPYLSSSELPQPTQAADSLTGVKIEKASRIQIFVFLYVGLIIICVIYGIRKKKHLQIWTAMALFSVIATFLIFFYAAYRSKNLSKYNATILQLNTHGTAFGSSEKIVSLMSKSEEKIDLDNKDVDTKIRSMPPKLKKGFAVATASISRRPSQGKRNKRKVSFGKADSGEGEGILDPLKVINVEGKGTLPGLKLLYQKPKVFSTLSIFDGQPYPAAKVTWSEQGPQMAPWPIPDDTTPELAYLVLESGYYRLENKSGKLELTSDRNVAVDKRIEATLLSYFMKSSNPAPFLVLFNKKSGKPSNLIPEKFDISGRDLDLYPVTEVIDGKTVYLPPTRSRLEFVSQASGLIDTHGEWSQQSGRSLKAGSDYGLPVDGFLPALYCQMKVKTIEIDFKASNRGRNLTFGLRLVPVKGKGKGLDFKQTGDRYVLEMPADTNQSKWIDPSNGQYQLEIRVGAKRSMGPTEALRGNSWKIQTFEVAFKGQIPDISKGQF